MVEIIPGINVLDWVGVRDRLVRISPYTDWVEIDVSDGKFTSTVTWNNPADLEVFESEKYVAIAIHVMAYDPEKIVPVWVRAGIRRIIVQYEGIQGRDFGVKTQKITEMRAQCQENWVEFGLSITMRTPLEEIVPHLPSLRVVQVLAVEPGPSGQHANPDALSVVEELQQLKGGFKIEWDGGVNVTNVRKIKNAGADIIVAASSIFGSTEPGKNLEELKKEVL